MQCRYLMTLTLLALGMIPLTAHGAEPVAWWRFDNAQEETVRDSAAGIDDPIEGRFKSTPGASHSALKFDGFTTLVSRKADAAPKLGDAFTIEAWIALGAYPWNWCPIVSQREGDTAGYYFAVGPRGELSLQLAVDGKWQVCTSEDFAVPLRKWIHVAGTYGADGLAIYLDGKQVNAVPLEGKATYATDTELRIGVNHIKRKPSHIHREFGTIPAWFSFDGIIDELKIYDKALPPGDVAKAFRVAQPSAAPDLPLRQMPSGPKGPGRFGAYYCKLKYYDAWDALWRVGPDPDVIVRFDQSDARLVFWRGSRYSAAWVTNDGLWMADQSVEAWNNEEGCFEHMQDRLCRYSHVRIIESNDARAVVHWRYAPVSAYNHLWREDEKTGRACWVDEYYTIYPDAMGIRKVTWKKDTLGHPRQFQESLPFTQPGQYCRDVVEADFATVANMQGETLTLRFVENPKKPKENVPEGLTVQRYNFVGATDPFIIYEEGNQMRYVADRNIAGLDRPGACNHWPVGQARCDGRTSQAPDRPTHFLGFPISSPPLHEKDDRCWWNGIYGMTSNGIDDLIVVAKSWNHPPKLTIRTRGFAGDGYDRGQRAYVLDRRTAPSDSKLELELAAGEDSPLFNPAMVIRGWGASDAEVTINGQPAPAGKDLRIGHRHRLDRSDLILWMKCQSTEPVKLTISPAE